MRSRQRGGRRSVPPGPEDHALRARERLEAAEDDVRVAVGPAGHDHRRAGDPVVVRPHRAVPPVRPVDLLLDPAQQPRLGVVDPPLPLLAPAGAEHRRHRRQRVAGDHVELVVDQVDRLERATHVVDVVVVAVVRGVDRHDRVECRRAQAGDLERVEARPGRAVHPDAAVRPLLLRQPRDHLADVVELGRRVLVGRDPFGRAGPADVEPADREAALLAEALVLRRVGRREVVHPVRERLDHDRCRALVGQPELRREARAVGHGDEGAPVLHGAILPGRVERRCTCNRQPSSSRSGPMRPPSVPACGRCSKRTPSGGARECSPTATRSRSIARSARQAGSGCRGRSSSVDEGSRG